MPAGRFVSAVTDTPIGPVEVIGVCVPWRDAFHRTGPRDRRPWQAHAAYLSGLGAVLAREPRLPRIVLGDFNQPVPRANQPAWVFAALMEALGSRHALATYGLRDTRNRAAIDHFAHSGDLTAQVVGLLPHAEPDGLALSDHFGVVLEVLRPTPA